MSDEGRSVVQLKTIALFLFLPNLYRYTGFYSYRRPHCSYRRPHCSYRRLQKNDLLLQKTALLLQKNDLLLQIYRLLQIHRRRLRVNRRPLRVNRRPLRVNRRPRRVNRGLLLLMYRCIGFCKWVLEICLTSKNTVSIIINRISPIPKCTVTSSACNFSTITIAPRVICPTTNAAAIIDTIFVDLEVSFDLKVKNMVINTMIPVVAATVLWKYSIKNSFIGIRPAGHSGH